MRRNITFKKHAKRFAKNRRRTRAINSPQMHLRAGIRL